MTGVTPEEPSVSVAVAAGSASPQRSLPSDNDGNNNDSDSGDDDSYEDSSSNDLTLFQAAALLTADCLGTGILALPADIRVLGRAVGLLFLAANVPLNLFAGAILSHAAARVEEGIGECRRHHHHPQLATAPTTTTATTATATGGDRNNNNSQPGASDDGDSKTTAATAIKMKSLQRNKYQSIVETEQPTSGVETFDDEHDNASHHHDDACTFDFIGMTHALYHNRFVTRSVLFVYYCNLFLVLGDYILVMSHAVAAMMGDRLCIPLAGAVASTLMFGISQLRTMANLGRSASIISLTALFVVLIQCLLALVSVSGDDRPTPAAAAAAIPETSLLILPRFSALASIGFAVGSQKLFLNIRHEMKRRHEAPTSLAISLTFYVTAYVIVSVVAGPNPPSFLFDAIRPGWNRRLAGLLLWIHVAVSYAINSQAICSSMDRLFFRRRLMPHRPARQRWMLLTLGVSASSYAVANAIPFFRDLVSLTGALTSVPLTLALPAALHRRAFGGTPRTAALLLFAVALALCGLLGAVSEIEADWLTRGTPFACE